MTKVKRTILLLLLLTLYVQSLYAQQFTVRYHLTDTSGAKHTGLKLKTHFQSWPEAGTYIDALVPQLRDQGFISASIDSLFTDSMGAQVWLYVGEQYAYSTIRTQAKDQSLLEAIRWPSGKMEHQRLLLWKQRILDWLEENGHPFGSVSVQNISFQNSSLEGDLVIDRGPIYHIDSIRVHGDVSIRNEFLQKYLQLTGRTVYNSKKLQQVSKQIAELGFLAEDRPADISMLGTGAVLNLYLKQQPSSRVHALVGLLPSTDLLLRRRMILAVDANVLLKNALGAGETIGVVWQQLQQQSPRLNLLYEHPYIFRSQVGLQFAFDMFKQDTSFVNINMKLGGGFALAHGQSASVFLLMRQSMISHINTDVLMRTRRLPQDVDVQSMDLGLTYRFNNTDYRLNPRRGTDIEMTGAAGTKQIKKSNEVLQLKDPSDPTFSFASLYDSLSRKAYQFRWYGTISRYVPLGSQTVLKLATQGGIYQSSSYFRNELFRIGGYKIMRGFNDESQYVSQYIIGTAEFRYLVGLNSAFFAFVDGGTGRHLNESKKYHQYMGAGIGMSFQTRAGMIQLALAAGKRDDMPLNLGQSKIHIGFASYF